MASDFRIDREARAESVRRIRAYFEREREEQLGELAAGFFLDFIIEELGPLFYNAGLADAQALLARHVDSLDADIEAHRREPPLAPRMADTPGERTNAERAVLHTTRLVLRPFRPEDATAFESFAGDEAYRRYLDPTHPAIEAFMRHNVNVDWQGECAWVICLAKPDGPVAGSAFLGIDSAGQTGELAYLMAPTHWGKGIATEAAAAVIDYAFGARRLARVIARADARNEASLRVMEKLGMTVEPEPSSPGRRGRRGRRATVLRAISASEWSARADR